MDEMRKAYNDALAGFGAEPFEDLLQASIPYVTAMEQEVATWREVVSKGYDADARTARDAAETKADCYERALRSILINKPDWAHSLAKSALEGKDPGPVPSKKTVLRIVEQGRTS